MFSPHSVSSVHRSRLIMQTLSMTGQVVGSSLHLPCLQIVFSGQSLGRRQKSRGLPVHTRFLQTIFPGQSLVRRHVLRVEHTRCLLQTILRGQSLLSRHRGTQRPPEHVIPMSHCWLRLHLVD